MNLDEKNRDRTHDATPAEMDDLLAAHFASGEELTPSSGFTLSVMEALHAEASAPPPIPFPWRRVVPGLIAVLCVMAGFVVFALRELHAISGAGAGTGSHGVSLSLASGPHIHLTTLEQALCWIAASACLSIAVAAGSMRLAGR